VFFLVQLPANIYSALKEVGMGGHGPAYLLFRIPLQIVFIGWAVFFTGAMRKVIRRPSGMLKRAHSRV
jgi:uncharacterized membrane protein